MYSKVTYSGEYTGAVIMGTVTAHFTILIRKWTPKGCKVFTLDARERIYAISVNAVLCCRVFCYFFVGTVTTQLMGVIYPPAHSIIGMVTRIVVRTTANFTYSVTHTAFNL